MGAEPEALANRIVYEVQRVLERLQRPPAPEPLKLVVACSGGLDSSVLLWAVDTLARPLNLFLVVAHLNHGLRGAESMRDEAFVCHRAQSLGWPVEVRRLEGLHAHARAGRSLQVVAREARQQFLEETRQLCACHYTLLAHTRTDQAETLLLRLLRGTGTAGLVGMEPVQGERVRPLLALSRTELASWVRWVGLPYVEDSSNEHDDYLRNRVRHHVMPLLQGLNPALEESLAGLALSAQEDQRALDLLEQKLGVRRSPHADAPVKQTSVPLRGEGGLLSLPPALQLRRVRQQLERLWPSEDEAAQPGRLHFRALLEQLEQRRQGHQAPWQQDWPGRLRVKLAREHLWLERNPATHAQIPSWQGQCGCPGQLELPDGTQLRAELEPMKAGLSLDTGLWTCLFDAELLDLTQPLDVRAPQADDCFIPFGKQRPVRLRDFLKKQPASSVESTGPLLVFCGSALIWIIGLRRGAQAPLSASTRRLVRLWVHQRDAA